MDDENNFTGNRSIGDSSEVVVANGRSRFARFLSIAGRNVAAACVYSSVLYFVVSLSERLSFSKFSFRDVLFAFAVFWLEIWPYVILLLLLVVPWFVVVGLLSLGTVKLLTMRWKISILAHIAIHFAILFVVWHIVFPRPYTNFEWTNIAAWYLPIWALYCWPWMRRALLLTPASNHNRGLNREASFSSTAGDS